MRPVVLLAVCGLMLSGCTGMTSADCGPDWYQIGQRDGRLGAQPQAERYAARCGAGGQPDAARYTEGYQAGFAQRPPPNW